MFGGIIYYGISLSCRECIPVVTLQKNHSHYQWIFPPKHGDHGAAKESVLVNVCLWARVGHHVPFHVSQVYGAQDQTCGSLCST